MECYASLTMALGMAATHALFNIASNELGQPTDFPGIRGSLIMLVLSLPVILILAYVGGAVGNKLNGS